MRTVVLTVLALSLSVQAQSFKTDVLFLKSDLNGRDAAPRPELTGVLSNDLFASYQDGSSDSSEAAVETRSALEAGAFSLVIPGAGQIYNRNYLKAAIFLAVEAAAWTVNIVYTQKANNQTTFFEHYADGSAAADYADGHYSVERYAQWIQANWQQLLTIGGHNPADNTDPSVQILQKYEPTLVNPNGGPTPWDKVDWYALNQIEGALGGYFSHLLPPHGNQQYYELIGKYPQFRQGWNDSPYAQGNTNFTSFMDYATTNSGYYMDQRGKANSLFATASLGIAVALVNHFASAIEAAIWAHNHNLNIKTRVSLAQTPIGPDYRTQLELAVGF